MGVRTSYHHNKDGSVTKRTTYSRKTIFGNRKSESFSERIPAGGRRKSKHGLLKWLLIIAAIALVVGALAK